LQLTLFFFSQNPGDIMSLSISQCEDTQSQQQQFGVYSGFIQNLYNDTVCLAVDKEGCNVTSMAGCTIDDFPKLEIGDQIVAKKCNNGDARQRYSVRKMDGGVNVRPSDWASAPWIGDGLLGARIETLPAGTDLYIPVDRTDLIDGGMRQKNGNLKLSLVFANSKDVQYDIRHDLYKSVIRGGVTDVETNTVLLNFTLFANAADIEEFPVVALEVTNKVDDSVALNLEWTCDAEAWCTKNSSNVIDVYTTAVSDDKAFNTAVYISDDGSSAFVSISPLMNATIVGDDTSSTDSVWNAITVGTDALKTSNAAWWENYYPKTFVSLPDTRLEANYWLQTYRYAASDRVNLHGLDGAFGPSSGASQMFNFWPDQVWDMNQQVMYWGQSSSNREEIIDPLVNFTLNGGIFGAGEMQLWFLNNAYKTLATGSSR